MRFVLPIILIGVAVAGFFMFLSPAYNHIQELRVQSDSYDQALSNSKALEQERDKLVTKYNAMSKEDLDKLAVLLPDSVDNIRLILEIEKIASPYNMSLRDVKYSSEDDKTKTTSGAKIVDKNAASRREYGSWDLQFSTQGSYANFNRFIGDLEKNLRIVDVASIEFSSEGGVTQGLALSQNQSQSDNYKYTVKIKTYWLKN
ncbi:MAG: hypothetical protein V4504_02115 [Patescibacteria group bacterium]